MTEDSNTTASWKQTVMSTFESSGVWGFGRTTPPPPQEKYPLRRVEPALRKFVKVADIDLGRLQRHKMNIEELRARGDVAGLRKEHINATRTVQQLQAHMRQLAQTRNQVQESDLPAFDKKVQGVQKKAFEAAEEFLRTYSDSVSDPLAVPQLSTSGSTFGEAAQNDHDKENSPLLGEQRLQAQIQAQLQTEADAGTQESWQDLQKGLTELNGLIHCFANAVATQQEQVDRIEDNIEKAQENVHEGAKQLAKASVWKAAMFPAFGALIGGAVGGPVGFVAGIKVGGMAAVGGGLIGLTGGTFLKKRRERVIDMELQNLSTRNATSMPDLPTTTPTESESVTITTRKSS